MKHYILLIFSFFSVVFSQNGSDRPEFFLDSLLTQKEFHGGSYFYNSLDSTSKGMLINRISMIDTSSDISCRYICSSFIAQKVTFDSTRIPSDISKFYQASAWLISRDQLKKAVKIYYVAFALRTAFINIEKKRLLNNYYQFIRFISEANKDSVENYIHLFEKENKESPAFVIVDDELHIKNFYETTKKDIVDQQHVAESESQYQDFQKTFSFSLGISGGIAIDQRLSSLTITDYILQNNYSLTTKSYSYPNTSANALQYHISFEYAILPNFSSLVSYTYGKYSITLPHSYFQHYIDYADGDESFDDRTFSINNHLFVVTSCFTIRARTGLRPFVEAGCGIVYSRAEKKKLLTIYSYTFYSPGESNYGLVVPVTGGVEYIQAVDSKISYNLSLGDYLFFVNNNLSGSNSFNLNFKIGYLF
jgi:hypothetical protein